MKTFLKWALWVLLVLPVSFLMGAAAGAVSNLWNWFVFGKIFGDNTEE